MIITKISLKFRISRALKLLIDNPHNGILPLGKKRTELFVEKQSDRIKPSDILMQGPTQPINRVAYDDIDASLVTEVPMLTKRGSAPSGIDVAGVEFQLFVHLEQQQ